MGLLQKSGKHEWVRKGYYCEQVNPIIVKVGLVLDFLWSGLVVAPLVVLYWRGTWDLLEDFVSFK